MASMELETILTKRESGLFRTPKGCQKVQVQVQVHGQVECAVPRCAPAPALVTIPDVKDDSTLAAPLTSEVCPLESPHGQGGVTDIDLLLGISERDLYDDCKTSHRGRPQDQEVQNPIHKFSRESDPRAVPDAKADC